MPSLPGGIPGCEITLHINTVYSMLVGNAINLYILRLVGGMRVLSECNCSASR